MDDDRCQMLKTHDGRRAQPSDLFHAIIFKAVKQKTTDWSRLLFRVGNLSGACELAFGRRELERCKSAEKKTRNRFPPLRLGSCVILEINFGH
jgi:hypothetical protein